MPVMDGYEATRQIRAMQHLTGQRVIAMTANAMAEDRRRCLFAGMDDFITKPIDQDQLYLSLAKWLPKNGDAQKEVAPMPLAEAAAINLAILGKMVKNDPAKIRKFSLKFVQTARDTLLDMDLVNSQHNLVMLGSLGHKLKSSARTVGAIGFAELCEALEVAGETGDWQQVEVLLPRMSALLERIAQQVERETTKQEVVLESIMTRKN